MAKLMKAVVAMSAGEYALREVEVPEAGIGELLCRIKSVAICGSDPGLFSGKYQDIGWPPKYPFIFGHEWAGEVVGVGPEVKNYQIGDRVAGEAHGGCGVCENCKKGKYTLCLNYGNASLGHRHYGFTTNGAYAEYGVFRARAVEKIPDGISFDEATMCDTGGVALQSIRIADVSACEYVVIYGPGPIGNLAMQIAKANGAITIMVGRGDRLSIAQKCGADYVVNYEHMKPVDEIMRITNGIGADAAVECAGTQDAIYNSVMSVRKDGRVSLVSLPKTHDLPLPVMSIVQRQIHVSGSRANPNCSKVVMEMIKEGKIQTKYLITHRFALSNIKEALDIFSGRKDGVMKVVLNP